MKKRFFPWLRRLLWRAKKPLQWLVPGLGVKRWLVVTLAGTTLIGVGLAILILDVYRTAPDTWWLPLLSAASLRSIARPLRALIFGGLGLGLILTGIWGINRSLMDPFIKSGRPMVDALTLHRRRERGAKIVAIGGGTGLSALLRGIKEYTYNITAVVSVADDGGSSGRIRRQIGILPPGDIRNCLAALSNDEAMMTQIFQYRFSNGHGDLVGHSFGNLFITALSEITGSFEEAVAESGRVLSVHGRVLPSTIHDVRLVADVSLPFIVGEVRIEGESHIPELAGRVRRVWLDPNNPPGFPDSVRAILAADMIVVGPGSLYTSIIPNLLVPDLAEAIRSSRALRVFICNVATQPGETDGYSGWDHIRAVEEHIGQGLFDIVVVNRRMVGKLPAESQWVLADDEFEDVYAIYQADVVDEDRPWRHDSKKLARVLMDLLQEKTGPLVE